MVKKLAARFEAVSFAYEAGPCGYGLHRHLIGLGHVCDVVAPSRTPVQPGKRRVKNDTIDALNLARLHRAGELTYIWTPDATHEAMQDLVKARRLMACRRATAATLRSPRLCGGSTGLTSQDTRPIFIRAMPAAF